MLSQNRGGRERRGRRQANGTGGSKNFIKRVKNARKTWEDVTESYGLPPAGYMKGKCPSASPPIESWLDGPLGTVSRLLAGWSAAKRNTVIIGACLRSGGVA